MSSPVDARKSEAILVGLEQCQFVDSTGIVFDSREAAFAELAMSAQYSRRS